MHPDPDYFNKILRLKNHSSFSYSFLFLPRAKRQALEAIYAFCREMDDTADCCAEASVVQSSLNMWKDEVAQLYCGVPRHPITRALLPVIHSFSLPQKLFIKLIRGMEMDIGKVRYANFTKLRLYCYYVASIVGYFIIKITGYTHPDTVRFAYKLGIALQLINIIRDIREDAARGRIYLPQNELHRFGVSESQILNGQISNQFVKLINFQIQRAELYYKQALMLLPQQDRHKQRVSLAMANIYYGLLKRIQAKGAVQVLTTHVSLTPFYKIYLAIQAYLKA